MIDDIWIECDEPSHPTNTANVERQTKDARGWQGMGFVLARDSRQSVVDAEREGRRSKVPKRTSAEDTYGQPKYNLRCPLCGLEPRATIDRLAPVLDTLAENDVPRITLRALDARLA